MTDVTFDRVVIIGAFVGRFPRTYVDPTTAATYFCWRVIIIIIIAESRCFLRARISAEAAVAVAGCHRLTIHQFGQPVTSSRLIHRLAGLIKSVAQIFPSGENAERQKKKKAHTYMCSFVNDMCAYTHDGETPRTDASSTTHE